MSEAVQGQAPVQPAMPESVNPHEAVALLSQLIDQAEEAAQTPRDEKGKFVAKEKPEAKAEEAKPETEAPKEEAEGPKPEEEKPEITPESRKFKLKYKGEEKEVDEPEAIELAQKGYDYTQKSQALAKEREELSVKVKSEQEAARKAYEQQLEIYRQATLRLVDNEVLNADLAKLAVEDPAKAQALFFKRQAVAETLTAIHAEQQKLIQQRESEGRETLQKLAKQSLEKLPERIPGWSKDLYSKVLQSGEHYGYQTEELNAIVDHRALEVLNDARQWREYQSAKPKTVEKKVPPVAPKVQKPGGGEKPEPKANRVQERMAALEKSGSRGDAEAYVQELINSGKFG